MRKRVRMKRFAFALCGFLALPLAAWGQSRPAAPPADQVEQRLKKLRDAQKPRNAPDSPTLTPGEMQALMNRLAECWAAPAAAYKVSNLTVAVNVRLAKDGSLAEPPKVLNSNPDPRFAATAKSVIAALTRCAPFSFLPAAKYAAWQEIIVDFDPRPMLGDKPR